MIVRTAQQLLLAAAQDGRALLLRGGNGQGNQQRENLAFTG